MYKVVNDTWDKMGIVVYVTDSYTAARKVAEEQEKRNDVLITEIHYKGKCIETVLNGGWALS